MVKSVVKYAADLLTDQQKPSTYMVKLVFCNIRSFHQAIELTSEYTVYYTHDACSNQLQDQCVVGVLCNFTLATFVVVFNQDILISIINCS